MTPTSRVHAAAGCLALVLVAAFLVATLTAEASGDPQAILLVKTAIVFAMVMLVPSVMIAGATGRSMAAGRRAPLLRRKQRRTVAVATIGIGVLVPCAVTLRMLAPAGRRPGAFRPTVGLVAVAARLSSLNVQVSAAHPWLLAHA